MGIIINHCKAPYLYNQDSMECHNPDAPCMEYLPTFGKKRLHSRGNGLVNIPVPWSMWVRVVVHVEWKV